MPRVIGHWQSHQKCHESPCKCPYFIVWFERSSWNDSSTVDTEQSKMPTPAVMLEIWWQFTSCYYELRNAGLWRRVSLTYTEERFAHCQMYLQSNWQSHQYWQPLGFQTSIVVIIVSLMVGIVSRIGVWRTRLNAAFMPQCLPGPVMPLLLSLIILSPVPVSVSVPSSVSTPTRTPTSTTILVPRKERK